MSILNYMSLQTDAETNIAMTVDPSNLNTSAAKDEMRMGGNSQEHVASKYGLGRDTKSKPFKCLQVNESMMAKVNVPGLSCRAI